jgi:oxygen-independent coproporphyrinogen-3 oxidase
MPPESAKPANGTQTDAHPTSDGVSRRNLGIYVHFPWCLRKCPYCDFLSIARGSDEIPRQQYTQAVCSELEQRSQAVPGDRVRSVFFGGGTPSLWGARGIGTVLETIARCFRFTETPAEISVECNPTSFSLDTAKQLRAEGVGRISLGLQSLDPERLRFLGRLHDVAGGLAALGAALDAGFPEVSADLIYGVAGQTPAQARQEAVEVAKMGVTHLSAYALTIEPGTQFGALQRKGRLPLLTDDAVADSFTAVHEALAELGFEHYEISNFCRPGHPAQHNLGYWRGQPYLGIGCGAWGTITLPGNDGTEGWLRYRNTPSVDRYLSVRHWPTPTLDSAGPGRSFAVVEPLDAPTRLVERLMLGLRLSEGVDLEALSEELGQQTLTSKRLETIQHLAAQGSVTWDGQRLAIPPAKWLLADGLIARLA